MTIYASATDQQLVRAAVALRSPNPCKRFEPCASDDPAFAMINDLAAAFPALAGTNRVRIEIIAGDRAWAFSTITNNQAQHVTVITPQ